MWDRIPGSSLPMTVLEMEMETLCELLSSLVPLQQKNEAATCRTELISYPYDLLPNHIFLAHSVADKCHFSDVVQKSA